MSLVNRIDTGLSIDVNARFRAQWAKIKNKGNDIAVYKFFGAQKRGFQLN
jgi:hypothetical protein